MSARKKQKLMHVDENEHDSSTGGLQQTGVARQREDIKADPSLPVHVRDLLAKLAKTLEQKEAKLLQQAQELEQKDAELLHHRTAYGITSNSLKEAMKVIFRHATMASETCTFFSSSRLPSSIRFDPDCLIIAIRDKNVYLKQSDIPREMLRNRLVAMEACKAGICHDFNPTPDDWQDDQVLSRIALKRGLITNMSQAPMLTDQDVLDLLREEQMSWEIVPGDLKGNENFCQCVLQLGCASQWGCTLLVQNVFETLPSLAQKWQSWKHICSSFSNCPPIYGGGGDSCHPLIELVKVYAPPPCFLSNDNFMEMLYKVGPKALQFADSDLLKYFVQEKIGQWPHHMAYCSEAFLGRSRGFVEKHLIAFCNSLYEQDSDIANHLLSKLPQGFREDKAFVTLWVQAGLPTSKLTRVRYRPVHTEGMTLRDKLLLTAQHGRYSQWKLDALSLAPDEVRNDLPFIKTLMEYEPALFAAASEEIRNNNDNNFELAMAALKRPAFVNCCRQGHAQAASSGQRRPIFSAETLKALVTRAKHDINLHDKFVKTFLSALHCVADRDGGTSLQMVVSELYGIEDLKQLIGEFVGLPRGEILHNMRAALTFLQNLAKDLPAEYF